MLKRLVFLLAILPAAALADQPPAATGPKIAAPHNCISFYPEAAVRADAEGTATVAFTIAADGSVKDPKIAKSSGNKDLDDASIQCVSGWRYTAATRDGVAVEAPWQAAVQWKMHGGSDYRMTARCVHYLDHGLTAPMVSGNSAVTALTFRVMPGGKLDGIAVARSSGDKDLDDAALRCVGAAHYNSDMLDIPAEGIPAHALLDWRSEFTRSVPLTPPYPAGLTMPVLLDVDPCKDLTPKTGAPPASGTTALEFTVATDGSVKDVHLVRSSADHALDDATAACVARWRFTPANDHGVPYAIKWGMMIDWRAGTPQTGLDKL